MLRILRSTKMSGLHKKGWLKREKRLIYQAKAKKACAKAPLLLNPGYIMGMIMPPRKKRKKKPVTNS